MTPESASLERWRNPILLEETFKRHYVDLPYHNFEHAQEARSNFREIVQYCIDAGEPMDFEEVEDGEIALLGHDSGFYVPLHIHGFRSKEEYSANITASELRNLGMPEQRISRIASYILGTELGVPPAGRVAKAVRRADIYGVAYDSPRAVLQKTLDLFYEDQLLKTDYDHHGLICADFVIFARKSFDVLSLFNQDDVSLGDFDVLADGRSSFTARVEGNLPYFVEPKLLDLLPLLGVKLAGPTSPNLTV